MTSSSPHVRSLDAATAEFESELGSVQVVDAGTFPLLSRLSIKRLVLQPFGVREPQWNVNANQLAYVVSGTVLVNTLGNADFFSSFVVGPGQMYHVESGALYHIENVGSEPAEIIFALRAERPQHFSLNSSFAAMTNSVLGNTYDLPSSAWDVFDRTGAHEIVRRDTPAAVTPTQRLPNARLFDCEGQLPPLATPQGHGHLARRQYWAALQDISMYSLRIRADGMREPHWHPVTAEMGYVAKGAARMRVLDPDGTLDEYVLSKDEVYFIPRAYPHHIEVLGEDEFHFLIFFDQPTPGDVGYRASASAFSREVLAASFDIPERALPQLPFTPVDPLIVGRPNPLDPI